MIESYIVYGLKNLKHTVTIIYIEIYIVYSMFEIFSDKIFKSFGQFAFLIYQSVNFFIFLQHI